MESTASITREQLWDELTRIGGRNGWYAYPLLWKLRGAIDRLVGGPGMRRGRRDAVDLRVGDAVDFWRVVRVEPQRRITLLAEMKLPGRAVLEFQVNATDSQYSQLTTEARFHPAGTLGLLYWYALIPLHGRIFKGITRLILKRAQIRADRSAV